LIITVLRNVFSGRCTGNARQLARASIHYDQIRRKRIGIDRSKDILAAGFPSIQGIARQRGLREHCAGDK